MRKPMLFLAVLGAAGLLWAADPFVGTWKMNPAKSKFSSFVAPKSFTVTFAAQENGVNMVQDILEADGKVIHRSVAFKYDGKDHPVTAPDIDTVSATNPNANTIHYAFKKGGKESYKGRAAVSKDGKTFADNGGGKDSKRQEFTYSFFMEKQQPEICAATHSIRDDRSSERPFSS